MVRTITVSEMTCEGCEENAEDALKTIDGVTQVHADHETETVETILLERFFRLPYRQ